MSAATEEQFSFILTAHTWGFEGKLQPLVEKLQGVKGVDIKVEREPLGFWIGGAEFALIISVGANILTIADIIARYLKERRQTETRAGLHDDPSVHVVIENKLYGLNSLSEEEMRNILEYMKKKK